MQRVQKEVNQVLQKQMAGVRFEGLLLVGKPEKMDRATGG